MTVEIACLGKEISRRAALGGVGALVAAPALAVDARLDRHCMQKVRSFGWTWIRWSWMPLMIRVSMHH
jgi:hypothetical protein